MDKIRFQKFKQVTPLAWEYEISTICGIKYVAGYKVMPFGFIKETVVRNKTLLFEREFKPMDAYKPLLKIIEDDGAIA